MAKKGERKRVTVGAEDPGGEKRSQIGGHPSARPMLTVGLSCRGSSTRSVPYGCVAESSASWGYQLATSAPTDATVLSAGLPCRVVENHAVLSLLSFHT